MEKLYIIGNGFDMHHYLNTSYYAFSKYLHEEDKQLHDLLEKYISLPENEEDLWAKFEENLAYLDTDEILSENSDYLPDISSDDFRDRDWHTFESVITDIRNLLTGNLLERFRQFILQVKINKEAFGQKVELDSKALFLNFNYTDTLEVLYGINPDSISYIHNAAKSDCEYIILGHGMSPEQFEEVLPEPPDYLNEEELHDWYEERHPYDYPYTSGKESLMKYFTKMHKPTKQIISERQDFFDKLSTVKTIYVFGHSMSNVDLPYFEEIINSTNENTKWIISYYSKSSIDYYKKVMLSLGIEMHNYQLIKLNSILLNNNQLRINF